MRSELNVLWSLVAEKGKLSDPDVFYVCIARKIIGVLKRVHSWQDLGEYQTHLDHKQNFIIYFFARKIIGVQISRNGIIFFSLKINKL